MRRKIIEASQEFLIVCDNPRCDYKIENPTKDPNEDTSQYVDVPCPKCGENLLTRKDHELGLKFMKIVNFINKWFSWLTVFIPDKKPKSEDMVRVGFHRKITLEKIETLEEQEKHLPF